MGFLDRAKKVGQVPEVQDPENTPQPPCTNYELNELNELSPPSAPRPEPEPEPEPPIASYDLNDLNDLIPRGPIVPAGARLFYADATSRPCEPEEAFMWTYEGAPEWYYTNRRPPPAEEGRGKKKADTRLF